jgi:hypothetical protein
VYFRYSKEKMVMVIMNNSKSNTIIDTKRFKEIMGTKTTAEDVITHELFNLQKELTIQAKSAIVLEVK